MANRYATQDDANVYEIINVGDLIIEDTQGTDNIVYIPDTYQLNGAPLALNTNPGDNNKIAVRGNQSNGSFYLQTPDTVKAPLINGVQQDLLITNFDGQRLIEPKTYAQGYNCIISTKCPITITGEYVPGVSGDPNFTGIHHAKGWAYAKDRMGIRIKNNWVNDKINMSVSVTGSTPRRITMKGLAVGDGGYTVSIKTNIEHLYPDVAEMTPQLFAEIQALYDINGINIEGCVFSATEGEPLYLGTTQFPGHNFRNGLIKNCLFEFSGLEGIQMGHLSDNFVIKNCVSVFQNMWMFGQFQRYQENNMQWTVRSGNTKYQKNLNIGAADKFVYTSNDPYHMDETRVNNNPTEISDNFFSHGRHYGVYISPGDGGQALYGEIPTTFKFERNVFANLSELYKRLFPFAMDDRYDTLFNIGNNTNPIYINKNTIPSGRNIVGDGSGNANVHVGTGVDANIVNDTPPMPKFANSGFPDDFNYFHLTYWFAKIGEFEPNFRAETTSTRSTPADVVGGVNPTIAQTLQLSALPKDANQDDVFTYFIGRKLRIYDKDEEYDSFCIATILAVDTVNDTITIDTPSYISNPSPYVNVAVDKNEAYITFETNEWCMYLGKFYKNIWEGDIELSPGRNPETEELHWEQQFWDDDGVQKDYPPGDWTQTVDSPYVGWGIFNVNVEEPEEPEEPPANLGNGANPRQIARRKLFYSILGSFKGNNLGTVENLSAIYAPDNGNISITWDDLGGMDSYEVFRDGLLIQTLDQEDILIGTFAYDFNVEEGNTYTYKVRGKKGNNYTQWSNEDTVIIEVTEEPSDDPQAIYYYQRNTQTNFYSFNEWYTGTGNQKTGWMEVHPTGFNDQLTYPCIIDIHGDGVTNEDPTSLNEGLANYIKDGNEVEDSDGTRYIAICVAGGAWNYDDDWADILTYALNHPNIDPDRIFLSGLSAGAITLMNFLNDAAYVAVHGNIAGAIILAGGMTSVFAQSGNDYHYLIHHNKPDTTVPVIDMADWVRRARLDSSTTIICNWFEGGGHNVWDGSWRNTHGARTLGAATSYGGDVPSDPYKIVWNFLAERNAEII